MSFKDKLLQDIRSYAKEYRWEELAAEQAIEIVELRPSKVFSYLYEKSIVRNKLDHVSAGKNAGMIVDVSFYCSYFDPLLHSRETFMNKIIGCAIEKYQQQKIKSTVQARSGIDLLKVVSIVLLDFESIERDTLMKPLLSRLNDSVLASQFAAVLYQTVLYRAAVEEILRLMEQLQEIEQPLTPEIFRGFMDSQQESTSCIKRLKLEPVEHSTRELPAGDVMQLLAESALLAVFGC